MGFKYAKPKFLNGDSGIKKIDFSNSLISLDFPEIDFNSFQVPFFKGFSDLMKDQKNEKN